MATTSIALLAVGTMTDRQPAQPALCLAEGLELLMALGTTAMAGPLLKPWGYGRHSLSAAL